MNLWTCVICFTGDAVFKGVCVCVCVFLRGAAFFAGCVGICSSVDDVFFSGGGVLLGEVVFLRGWGCFFMGYVVFVVVRVAAFRLEYFFLG